MARRGVWEITCYQLDPAEREEVARTGLVWLRLEARLGKPIQRRLVTTSPDTALQDG